MAGKRNARITPVQEEYLGLLRSALWGTPATIPQDIDGVRLIAKMQRTRPMIISALYSAGWKSDSQQPMELVRKTAATHVQINRCIAKVVTALREGGVEPVLLKGQGVAQNYLQPLLRECGDIDLYVGQEQFEKTCEIINGLATEKDLSEAKTNDLHYELPLGKMYLEIHRVSDKMHYDKADEIYQALADKGLSKDLVTINLEGVPVRTPSNDFNAFYLFCHMQRHFLLGGIGMRQMCDWTRFLHTHAGKIDPTFFESTLDALKLLTVWNMFASIAVDYLGLPTEEMPLYQPGMKDDAGTVLYYIFREGNFGQGHSYMLDENRPAGYLASKAYSIKLALERYRMLFRMYPGEKHYIWKRILRFYGVGIGQIFKDIFHK